MSFDPATDPRLLPVKGGIAAAHLKGKVDAKHFVAGERLQVATGNASLRGVPDAASEQINQALFGETMMVYDRKDGWAWGQLERDSYVGWMSLNVLTPKVNAPTHRVKAPRSILFEAANLKTQPLMAVSMNALLAVEAGDGVWRKVVGSGWIYEGHIAPVGEFETDFVAVAQRFVGAPYLWGGRESAGIDCSGLVQAALAATGVEVLRDSDMQAATIGTEVPGGVAEARRGDLVFWPGHVGIVLDDGHLLHANAWHMGCEIEPLREAVERIRAAAGDVKAVRRVL
jgi:cell wall-associated NlpC family hydrolase